MDTNKYLYRKVMTLYSAARAEAEERNRQLGRREVIGAPEAELLFSQAVDAATYGCREKEGEHALMRAMYTSECMKRVYEATLARMHSALLERLANSGKLPKAVATRRSLIRDAIGKKAYHGVVYSLGYFELNLILARLCDEVVAQHAATASVCIAEQTPVPAEAVAASPRTDPPACVAAATNKGRATLRKRPQQPMQLSLF